MNKLIIIRGNSGSGKTTVAEKIREKIIGKVALVSQDNLRRTILKEKDDGEKRDILGLVDVTVKYCLDNEYTVILEGILSKPKYGDLLQVLIDYKKTDSFVFYIDVSFKETVSRHQTKSNAQEFGENELKQWYQEKNYLEIEGEVVVPEESSLSETVSLILETIQ